jgi:HD-GYP domain-containing protein (c-di-GMP phosphodiesterase class II)
MVSGQKLLGKSGELLLNEGSPLSQPCLERLRENGYGGIYIKYDISQEHAARDIIGNRLRSRTVSALKEIFFSVSDEHPVMNDYEDTLAGLVNEILEKLLSYKSLIVNMQDLKSFDSYTFSHSVNVCVISMLLGTAMNLCKDTLLHLGLAAVLHDIGKVFLSKEIVSKPGKLTEEEYEAVKLHPIKGFEYLKENFHLSLPAMYGVLDHHRRYDGTGYPPDTAGRGISICGRIIAVSDVFDAFTSDRAYRKAMSPSEAFEYILGNCGNQFDPEIVKVFAGRISPYPIGTPIELSNGTKGIIMENNSGAGLRPRVKVLKTGCTYNKPYILDLLNDHTTLNITVTGIAYEL